MATCLITPSQLPPPADRHRYAAHSNVMSASELKLPYARPRSLTDPFCDHTPDHLASLLATPDRDLKWHDFQCLLGPFLPAGTYEESAYFLPLAFDDILTHDDDALDLVTSLVWFASEYASQLQRDNSLDAVRTKLKYCIDQWTGDFTILHFDHDAYREKGWPPTCRAWRQMSRMVVAWSVKRACLPWVAIRRVVPSIHSANNPLRI